MMDSYKLYIGANNDTKALEIDTIESITLDFFPDGFTLTQANGVWRGGKEPMATLEIAAHPDSRARIYELATRLKAVLKQQAIMVQVTSNANFNFI